MKLIGNCIDISKWQGTVDWNVLLNAYKSGTICGVIIRAGCGLSTLDSQFERNYREAHARGIPLGAYWYAYWQSGTPTQECTSFLQACSGKTFVMGLWYDVEYESSITGLSKKDRTAKTLEGLNVLKASGRYCGLYASTDMINNRMNTEQLQGWPIWVAQYASSCSCRLPYVMWQYSSKNALNIPGYASSLDCSRVYKDFACEVVGTETHSVESDTVLLPSVVETPRQTYTIHISEMSNGDLATLYKMAKDLGLMVGGTLLIGPMTGGDYKTMRGKAEALGLTVTTK